ncbi:MAG: haloacid dehalogenase type II [Planctomycetes bacterium]|nr:haloacid dehalogenase type II [Planctomycetota bacterium]
MRELSEIRALSFDCYGTLIDWRRGVREAAARVKSLAGADFERLERDRERFDAELGRGAYVPYRKLLGESLRLAAREQDFDVSREAAAEFAERMRDWPSFADTEPGLARLAARFRLAIFSNVETTILRDTLASRGWPIEVVVTAEEVGSYKPAPAHFVEGLRRLDLEPRRVLHCSITDYYDLSPARALGFRTAWIARSGETLPPGAEVDVTASDLYALDAALRGL